MHKRAKIIRERPCKDSLQSPLSIAEKTSDEDRSSDAFTRNSFTERQDENVVYACVTSVRELNENSTMGVRDCVL